MSEEEKRDGNDFAAELKDLPKEERLQVQGVILGLKMARASAVGDTAKDEKSA